METNVQPSPSKRTGLTTAEVEQRVQAGQVNRYNSPDTPTAAAIVKRNLFSWINLFYIVVAIGLIGVHAYTNLLYLVIITINLVIDIHQELHAKKLIDELSILSNKTTVVLRDGHYQDIQFTDVVRDDLIQLTAGNQIIADATVLDGTVEVDESLLTGEADAIVKHPGDQLLSGSFVVSGKALTQATKVGKESFAAGISIAAQKTKGVASKVMRTMKKIVRLTSYLVFPIGILLILEALFLRDQTTTYTVVSTATALLGILPMGMQLLISVSFISGQVLLSQRKVLVQNLYSLENLARTDIICLDKTGTITEGKISVQSATTVDDHNLPFELKTGIQAFLAATEDNNATFNALQQYYGAASDPALTPVAMTPFSSERKWSSVSFADHGTLVFGAPEVLVKHQLDRLPAAVTTAEQAGKRVLCMAYTPATPANNQLPDVRILVAVILEDIIRDDVAKTFAYFDEQAIAVKIISGDNPIAVSQIAKKAGIQQYADYVDMSQITTTAELEAVATKYAIFGRATPSQKKRLIQAMQAEGHYVTMVGDGVNDVLALKEASGSIAMNSGSSAAKHVAQVVLLDSNFKVLPHIIKEGRRVINNLTRVGSIFFVKCLYSIALSVICLLLNLPFPFLPIQISMIDGLVEGYPTFFLQFEVNNEKLGNRSIIWALKRAISFAIMITVGLGIMYAVAKWTGMPLGQARTLMFFYTGWVTIYALAKACYPFNAFRTLLLGSSIIAFFGGSFILQNIISLHVGSLTSFFWMVGITLIASQAFYWVMRGLRPWLPWRNR
ncbi:HAD-IC family P-type ATPase [Lactiplantibacillus plajomi]|uniref:HAD-IC family P-type ATPase n=1 Tax=Lactiplantibacillus plajomi TaxID=1457217 RepID=A0ABV6K009_9LACO|nr:HAD-IC family P-type ATPase [Lactiplantibacillus plajomi]